MDNDLGVNAVSGASLAVQRDVSMKANRNFKALWRSQRWAELGPWGFGFNLS